MTEPIRLVICVSSKFCNATGDAEPLYQRMVDALGEPADFRSTEKVRWERANCLARCGEGPNLVLLPEGRYFHYTTPRKLEAIIEEFIALREQA